MYLGRSAICGSEQIHDFKEKEALYAHNDMTGRKLLERVSFAVLKGSIDCTVSGICHDNRKLKEGDAFVCIKGARFDTHRLIGEIAQKAALIVADQEGIDGAGEEFAEVLARDTKACIVRVESTRNVIPLLAAAFYDYPSEGMTCVGITGSKGKTTCTHMLADIFRAAGYLTGTIGTNGAIFPAGRDHTVPGSEGFPVIPCQETPGYSVIELNNTTPDPMEMQMYLAMMKKTGCTHVVVEVSSQGMKQHRLTGLISPRQSGRTSRPAITSASTSTKALKITFSARPPC